MKLKDLTLALALGTSVITLTPQEAKGKAFSYCQTFEISRPKYSLMERGLIFTQCTSFDIDKLYPEENMLKIKLPEDRIPYLEHEVYFKK